MKASEFVICGIEGTALSKSEERFISHNPVGGIILFQRNISSLAQLIALNKSIIEANPKHCPLICVDQEGGRVARLRGICTDLPPMASLEKVFINDEKLAYRVGAMQGRELVALGFNLNFSPVCDVFCHEENEVIGDRAFSRSAKASATFTSLYIKGLQGSGIAACAKHFPGHGASNVDSHYALPRLETSLPILKTRELIPFQTAINANVATIMTAHIITTSIDKFPATMSEKTLNNLLRGELKYGNVIISDDLEMKAVADHYSLAEILTMGLLASVDLFIIGNNVNKTYEAIDLLQSLIDTNKDIKILAQRAQARIINLRNHYLGKPKAPDISLALSIVRSRPHRELLQSLIN